MPERATTRRNALRGVVFVIPGALTRADPEPAQHDTPDAGRYRLMRADGADELLRRCYGRYRIAAISTLPHMSAADAWQSLAGLDWHRYFETISSTTDLGTDSSRLGLYRTAATSLGIQPSGLAVVCENDADTLAAIHAAGCHPVAVAAPVRENARANARAAQQKPAANTPCAQDLSAVVAALESISAS